MAKTAVLCIVLYLCAISCKGDIQSDQKECQTQLQSLSKCFGYVNGTDKSPSQECCTNLGTVKNSKPKCLCILIKDSSNPALGFSINTTLALQMPSVCKVDAKTSLCPALLGISPNSPDAKIFGGTSNSSTTSSSSGSTPTSMSASSGSPRSLRGVLDAKTHHGFLVALVLSVVSVLVSQC